MMIRSAVTVCLVEEARGGPFVFHGLLDEGCRRAAALGFEGVEIFARSAQEISAGQIRSCLERHGLKLAAMGTGAGWVVERLSLSSRDGQTRRRAIDFVKGMVDLASGFGAPAIVGSMQGRSEVPAGREEALGLLAESLQELAHHVSGARVPLLFEPLNRYETDLCNRLGETADFLEERGISNVRLLADLFHMNIEEASLEQSLLEVSSWIGHVHFADSNRRAVGWGHTDWSSVARVLRDLGYQGYASAEVFPKPDSEAAARQTVESFRALFQQAD